MGGPSERCMIFDYDLTLFDLKLNGRVMIDHFRRATEALGVSHMIGSWKSAFKAYRTLVDELLLEDPDRDRIKRRLDEAMAAGEYEAYPRTEPYPGVKETLSYLRGREVRMGVVSSNSIRIIEATSRRFHVRRFFDAIWGRESYGRGKPAPDKILGCSKQLGSNHAFYVGDDPSDMDAAMQASCTGIAVIRLTDRLPTVSPAVLKERGAREILWGVRDLPSIVDDLIGE